MYLDHINELISVTFLVNSKNKNKIKKSGVEQYISNINQVT